MDREERMQRARRFVWTDKDLGGIRIIKKAKPSDPAGSEEKDEKTDTASAK